MHRYDLATNRTLFRLNYVAETFHSIREPIPFVRRAAAASKMRQDLKSNGGKLAHRVAKLVRGGNKEFVPPTKVITNKDGEFISHPAKIQEIFVEEWSEKVYKVEREKRREEDSRRKEERVIPKQPYRSGGLRGEDLYGAVQTTKLTVPGLGGWRVEELKALPLAAWQLRARTVDVQGQVGKVPESYKHVGTSMLP